MTRQILVYLMIAAFVLCLTGCGGEDPEETAAPEPAGVESILPAAAEGTVPAETQKAPSFQVELDGNGFPVYPEEDGLVLPVDELFSTGRIIPEVPLSPEGEAPAEDAPASEEPVPSEETAPSEEAAATQETGSPAENDAGSGSEAPDEGPREEDPEEAGAAEEAQPAAPEVPGYRNDFFGFVFAIPEDWSMAGPEALAGKHRNIPDGIPEADIPDALRKGGSFCAMYAETEHGEMSSKIMLERIRVLARDMILEEELAEGAVSRLETALRDRGTQPLYLAAETVRFLDEDHTCIRIEAMYENITVYERQVLLVRGSYVANVLAVSFGTDRTQEILDMYSALPVQEVPSALGAAALIS